VVFPLPVIYFLVTALVPGLPFISQGSVPLVAGLAFVTQLSRADARGDFLLEFFHFQPDWLVLCHLLSPPLGYQVDSVLLKTVLFTCARRANVHSTHPVSNSQANRDG